MGIVDRNRSCMPHRPCVGDVLARAMEEARIWVVGNFPFYGTLLAHLPFRVDPSCGTTWTDGRVIGYNPAFLRGLAVPEIRFLVLHEVLHAALGHVWRRSTRRPVRWNAAIDIVVNGILLDLQRRLPVRDAIRMPSGGLHHRVLAELGPAEAVYEALSTVNLPDAPGFDEHRDGGDAGADHQWKVLVAQAAQVAKSCRRGEYAGMLEALVESLLCPKVRWTEYLAAVATEVIPDDYDWMEPDEEFLHRGIIVPDLHSERCRVAFAVDTSGSMSEEEIQAATSEGAGLLRSRGVIDVRVIGCDAEVHYDRVHRPRDPVPMTWSGRGGTDFRPVFDRLEGESAIKLLVFFTDLEGEFPELAPPRYRVLWVSTSRNLGPPFGQTVRYEA